MNSCKTCFPIYEGRRIRNGSPTNNDTGRYILRTSDNRLFKREGSKWSVMNIPSNQKYVFHDIISNAICLINFGSQGTQPNPQPNPKPGPVVGPVVESTPQESDNDGYTLTAAGVVSNSNTLTLTSVPSDQQMALPKPIFATSGNTIVASGIQNNANFVVATVSNDSEMTVQAGEMGENTGSIANGKLWGGSKAILSDTATTAQFVALNKSTVHADQDSSALGGICVDCSKLQSSGPASMVRGTASNRSEIRTGGIPIMKNMPTNSRFTISQVGFGVAPSEMVTGISFNTSNGCADEFSYVTDSKFNEPLGFFRKAQILGSVGEEHSPGVGHGSFASGLGHTNSHILATANGSFAQGYGSCGEIHEAIGLASASFGRGVRTLGAYSHGTGHNSLATMHAQNVQAIPLSSNDNVPEEGNRVQITNLPLRGNTQAYRMYDDQDPDHVVGFRLETIMVLGDTPENALIEIENSSTLDYRRVPFLPVNGTAVIRADLVSSELITKDNQYTLPSFGGNYFFTVTRTGSNSNFVYDVEPKIGNNPSITTITEYPTSVSLGLDIVAEKFTGETPGFTVKITENIPFQIVIGGNTKPNPRITPLPPQSGYVLKHDKTEYCIEGRIWGGSFRYTEVPAGNSEVCFKPPLVTERVYQVPHPEPPPPVNNHNECSRCEYGDNPSYDEFTFESKPEFQKFGSTFVDKSLNPGF